MPAPSRRLLSFAAAGAAGGSSGAELGYGSDLVARSTALPALVGVGVLLGDGAVRDGAVRDGAARDGVGRLIAMAGA